ncbi:hypothetical protein NOCARDAX2BIS_160061 [Nocardioides sp. AX2bis]|nr:hypothetical protein NOCARDAX2BIS_160061 [Nocardioides sp. AX2bis]
MRPVGARRQRTGPDQDAPLTVRGNRRVVGCVTAGSASSAPAPFSEGEPPCPLLCPAPAHVAGQRSPPPRWPSSPPLRCWP